jgi:hypothetical protein
MDSNAVLIIFLVVFLIIALLTHITIINRHPVKPIPVPVPVPTPSHSTLIGGCAGTRYGCCPNGRTARVNPGGTNC